MSYVSKQRERDDQLALDFWRERVVADPASHVVSDDLARAFDDFREARTGYRPYPTSGLAFARRTRRLAVPIAEQAYGVRRGPDGKPLRAWWGVRLRS